MLKKLNKIFETIVVKVQINTEQIAFNIFDENFKEVILIKYGKEEIFVEIDLAFKEIMTIKALGLEVQSKESLMALEKLARRMMDAMKEIQGMHSA